MTTMSKSLEKMAGGRLERLLKRMTDRITHEVPGICRVAYDLTPKPVGTVEWE